MKNLKITVNGVVYDVQVEEADGTSAPAAAPAAAPKAAPAAAPKAAPAAAGGEPVKAPMPGTILDVPVKAGQSVKAGDVLVVENEIKAGRDAVVASVAVNKGESVDTGAVLVTLN